MSLCALNTYVQAQRIKCMSSDLPHYGTEEVLMSHSTSAGIRVVVVGAGMAGLTAALRLAERGYNVTVYEEKPFIGGQFGAHTHDGGATYHEHCYHFFLNWYFNFWKIAADIKCPRAT